MHWSLTLRTWRTKETDDSGYAKQLNESGGLTEAWAGQI
jgi:hypothetical protein